MRRPCAAQTRTTVNTKYVQNRVRPNIFLQLETWIGFSVKMQTRFARIFMAFSCIAALSALQMTDVQLERTLADRGTMQRHIRCALGEGPCDPVGIRLRTLAPLVLRGSCPQCSAQETRQIRRTLAFVQRNYPWEWAKIVRQYG